MRTLRLAALLAIACHAPACVETVREHRQARFTFESQPPGAEIEVLDATGLVIASGPAPVHVTREYDDDVTRYNPKCWWLTGVGGGVTVLGGVLVVAGLRNFGNDLTSGGAGLLESGVIFGIGGLALTVLSVPFCAMLSTYDGREEFFGAEPIRVRVVPEGRPGLEQVIPVANAGVRTYRLSTLTMDAPGRPPGAPAVAQPRPCSSACTDLVAGAAAAGVDEAGRDELIRKCFRLCGGDPAFTFCLMDNAGNAYAACAGLLK